MALEDINSLARGSTPQTHRFVIGAGNNCWPGHITGHGDCVDIAAMSPEGPYRLISTSPAGSRGQVPQLDSIVIGSRYGLSAIRQQHDTGHTTLNAPTMPRIAMHHPPARH